MKIWAVILRIYYWFRAKMRHEEDPVQRFRREQSSKKISVYLPFNNLRDYFNKVESKFGNALLHSPKLQAAVDKRLKMGSHIDSNEITINKYTSQQEYMKAAKQMFRESLNAELTPKKEAQDAVKDRIEKKSKSQKRAEATYKKSLEALRKSREEELKKLESDLESKPKQMLKETLARQMEDIGYLNRKQLDDSTVRWEITHNLVERFASLIFAEEIKNLPDTTRAKFGASSTTQGYYDKGLLRTVDEESRMDIVESMLSARMNHPKSRGMEDSDIYVKRDIHGTGVHVIIMFDRSGSMDENQRLDAAKRAVMALFKAIRLNNPQNVVDVIAFDTRAQIVSLMDVWNCQPKGFTNTGEALRLADQLLAGSKVDRRMVYMVTDGLPEAYRKGDEFIAGDNAKAMEYALQNANLLRRYKNLRFIMLLLEPKEQVYIDAAKKISEVVSGKIITTDPKKLVSDLLVDYIGK